MKARIASFIMTLMTILIIFILCFLGIIIYNEFVRTDIVSEVEEFVSNITISTESFEEDIEEPAILEVTTSSSETEHINKIEENINSSNNNINRYFYNQLNEYEKIIYDAMYDNKENMKSGTYEINMGSKFSYLLSKDEGEELLGKYCQSAIESYTYDNPDVFYIDYGKLCLNIETTTIGNKSTYKVFLNSGDKENYLTEEIPSKEKINLAINEIEKIKAYFIQNKKEDPYQNIKLVHDYLIESIEYDKTMVKPNIYDLYGALINKECVCAGYAKAFKYLIDALDIPCTIVRGLATNSTGNTEDHAWNYVQLNDAWYAVDCTWDDPILVGGGFLTNSLKYKYFLKGEEEFNNNHFPDGHLSDEGMVFEFPNLSQSNY